VIALRLGIDPNSLRVALIGAVVVAAAAIGRPVAVSQDAAAVLQRQSAVHA
jgi:predicted amino acid dehydrogenase